jgi:hypothetical protein
MSGIFDEIGDVISGIGGVLSGTGVNNASIDFRNETGSSIRVVMDSNRERHDIAPNGQATFSQANLGDAPTFHVHDLTNDLEIFSRRIEPITTPHSSLGFNGSTF